MSGAEPGATGMVTVSSATALDHAPPAIASTSPCGAASALTHGMLATHVPCEGLEQGA